VGHSLAVPVQGSRVLSLGVRVFGGAVDSGEHPSSRKPAFLRVNTSSSVASQKYLYLRLKGRILFEECHSRRLRPLMSATRNRRELSVLSSARAAPQRIAMRAGIVLGAADGVANKVLARQLSTSLPTVLLWRRRYPQTSRSEIMVRKTDGANVGRRRPSTFTAHRSAPASGS
jgi:hypothetical protein